MLIIELIKNKKLFFEEIYEEFNRDYKHQNCKYLPTIYDTLNINNFDLKFLKKTKMIAFEVICDYCKTEYDIIIPNFEILNIGDII